MSVKTIVATKINPDLISGNAATVELTFFDALDKTIATIPIPGRLFPKDIRLGESLMFIQTQKFNHLVTIEVVDGK